ncbi:uncharacterized protein MONOS_7095 [Monocercomonoides exilis]|uniref:uncharacterized protein n=1 Tax=Monocercomonoides exilis TaxID=2049356 RepID=UPI003559B20E|nr:hypothetical protein MONOS_7095 [Monocercomonoides exilis]|eukprot:MONOS_7095.1-p1 / transcript=MONOS_7095.1 / gene=MONOS_7095 / organism=Monocercomonoides_exilis_PA203 / gene_product=unspecified product / transcript_product=unspecified product / location=Mono_scaffold00235:65667-66757(+) / protein_length=346 / sequence_SO=supercontig / SO=protein_coding / is_pseudo=false
MIIEEDKKKEEKNKKLIADLCECYMMLQDSDISKKLLSICMSCVVKVALNKEETLNTQKEVEMALFVLGDDRKFDIYDKKLNIKKITEIIHYHQEHHNLTHVAYQSAWWILMRRFRYNKSLEDIIANELHFVREAAREMEALTRNVDWTRKEDKEMKERITLERWLKALDVFGTLGQLQNEEFTKLTKLIIGICGAAKCNHRKVYKKYYSFLSYFILQKAESEDYLLCEEAIDFILEEMHGPTIKQEVTTLSAYVFYKLSRILSRKKEKKNSLTSFVWFAWSWLNGKEKEESEKAKQKMMLYRKLREKMEEEGYEDIIISFYRSIIYFSGIRRLSKDLNYYFVYH